MSGLTIGVKSVRNVIPIVNYRGEDRTNLELCSPMNTFVCTLSSKRAALQDCTPCHGLQRSAQNHIGLSSQALRDLVRMRLEDQ